MAQVSACTPLTFVNLLRAEIRHAGVAVTLTVLICALLNFADSARLAGVAVAIVMLIGGPGRPWVAALHRFLEVSFGILIAVFLSALIYPSRSSGGS